MAAGAAVVAAAALALMALLLSAPALWPVVAACSVGGLVAGVASRRTGSGTEPSAARPVAEDPAPDAGPPPRSVDDLQAFFDHPPGSPAALTAGMPTVAPAPTTPAPPAAAPPAAVPDGPLATPTTRREPEGRTTSVGEPVGGRTGSARRRAGVLAAVVLAVVALGAVAVGVVTATSSASPSTPGSVSPGRSGATSAETSVSGADGPSATATARSSAAPLTAASAGDLAGVDVPPGDDGFTASVTFPGVVLEPRAVGVTVAYPVLTVGGDGTSAVVHLDLPVWNCLATTPPTDPVAAQCSRALEEHADLGTPDLVAERSAGSVDLSGSFATYTRPNGSPPAYTGSSYPVAATVTDGPGGDVTASLTLAGATVEAAGQGDVTG